MSCHPVMPNLAVLKVCNGAIRTGYHIRDAGKGNASSARFSH